MLSLLDKPKIAAFSCATHTNDGLTNLLIDSRKCEDESSLEVQANM